MIVNDITASPSLSLRKPDRGRGDGNAFTPIYELLTRYPQLTDALLLDHTTHDNIFWASDSYSERGKGYGYLDHITAQAVMDGLIVARTDKSRDQQHQRSREMAEVYTPAWICNKQNNLIDNAWFGYENSFNTEVDSSDGTHNWVESSTKVIFPSGKTWQSYVTENRLEITCGEAPYLVSRYDASNGEPIRIGHRVGLLDRKLRIVSENADAGSEWLKWAQRAYQSTYGFEWQGDSLFLARCNLLYSFIEYYRAKFGKDPQLKSLQYIAYIISWNIWQMDGLKGVIPHTCGERRTVVYDLFGETETITQCEGCKSGDIRKHNGTYALIKDWSAAKAKQKIRFIDLIK